MTLFARPWCDTEIVTVELTARLDKTFGKDAAFTQLTAADLKAMSGYIA